MSVDASEREGVSSLTMSTTPNYCGNCGAPQVAGASACGYCRVAFAGVVPVASAGRSSSDADIIEQIRGGDKIGAIKRYRERHNTGLLEAKEAVEALEQAHRRR